VVFKCLGEGILEKAFQGYNACIFAYGQTGKTLLLLLSIILHIPLWRGRYWELNLGLVCAKHELYH
jgi:hypothetical protein